ncbi:MAG: alpha/beta hydrolase [Nitrosomonadales bacterium]|nr:alpha/beta hydrolase [Nitrosomonadales bacterium]
MSCEFLVRMQYGRLIHVEFYACLIMWALLTGCSTPSQRFEAKATGFGFSKEVLQGEGFRHVVYFKSGKVAETAALHVYLDGDGTPWVRKGVAASDPSPRNPLMLDLMLLDSAPAVYLGRPCYSGLNSDRGCTSEVWTDRRYSETVVRSMSIVLEHLAVDYDKIILIGHSGGGTLAMLLAEQQTKLDTIVTIAANLDTARWVALHKQRPLTGSLNPADRPPLPAHIRQMHFAGREDDNVPPAIILDAIARQPGTMFRVIPGQDHSCCWREVWPEMLGQISSNSSSQSTGNTIH